MSLSSGGSRMVVVTNSGNMYIGTLSGTLQVAVTPTYNFIAAPSIMMGLAGGYKTVKISPSGTYIVAGAYISGGLIYVGKYDGSSWNFTPIPQSLSGFGPWVGAYVNNDGLRIHMGREGGQIVNGNVYGVVTTSSTSSTISGLTNGLSYSVFVTALNSAGLGPFALTTGQPDPLPDAPTDLVATVSDRLATLSWTASWDALLPISNYIISNGGGTIHAATSTNSVVVRGLSPYTSYTFTIYAVNSAGQSPFVTFPVVLTPAPSFSNQTVPFPDCLPWVWLDASDPTTITATGNTLTAWQNKGTAASNVGSIVGTVRTGTDSMNGRSVITMAPGSQMSLPSITALSSSAFAGFYVVRPTTDVKAQNTYINVFGQTTQTAPQLYLGGDSSTTSFTMNTAVSIPPYTYPAWIKQMAAFNTTGNEGSPSIAVDSIGNSYITYFTSGAVSGGTQLGGNDIVVLEMDPNGNILWIRQQPVMNTTQEDIYPQISLDASGNCYVAYRTTGTVSGGTFFGGIGTFDIVVFKLNTSGQLQWIRQQTVMNTTASDLNPKIVSDSLGNIYITYNSNGTVSGGTFIGSYDIVVLKMSTNGQVLWIREQSVMNTTGNDSTPVIGIDMSGNCYVSYSSSATASGGTFLGNSDIVVFKLDSNGDVQWVKQHASMNSVSDDYNPSIVVDGVGNSYITYQCLSTVSGGTWLGSADIVVFKLDTSGSLQWIKQNAAMNTTTSDVTPRIAVDGSSNIYVTYSSYGSVSGGTNIGNADIVVTKMDTNGTIQWIKESLINTSGEEGVPSISVDYAGNVYISYQTTGTVSGGTNLGSYDIVVFKILTDTNTNALTSSGLIDNQYQSIGLYSQVVNTITQPYVEWIKQHALMNTSGDDDVPDIAVDALGNIYITYQTNGTVSGGTSLAGTNVVVIKMSADGQMQWIKQQAVMNSIGNDSNPRIGVDGNGNIYVTYQTSGTISGGTSIGAGWNVVLFKMDTNGALLWIKEQAAMNTNNYNRSPSIAIDISGNSYVAYNAIATASGGTYIGGLDTVVFKMSTNGQLMWITQNASMNTTGNDSTQNIAVDGLGNSYVTYMTNNVVSGGTSLGGSDIALFKLNTNGVLQWTRQQSVSNNDYNPAIAVDRYNNVYVSFHAAGTVQGGTSLASYDIVVFKMDTNSTLQWIKQVTTVNTTANDSNSRITIDTVGNVYVTYQTTGTISGGTVLGGSDIVVFSMDTYGGVKWTRQQPSMNSTGNDSLPCIGVDGSGNVYITYRTDGTVSGGSYTGGLYDVTVMKFTSANYNYSRFNGSTVTLTANAPVTTINTSSALSYLLNNSAYNSGIQYAEMILFSGTVSKTLANQIEGYLAWKWGIQALLPSSHPYSIANCAATVAAFIRPRSFVTTFVGTGSAGSVNGTGTGASINSPTDVACDFEGNIYIVENAGCRIRKVTPSGITSTYAGSGNAEFANGYGTNASFKYPGGIAIDSVRNIIYVSEDQVIRKITADGYVSVLSGVSGTAGNDNGDISIATFDTPNKMAINSAGDLYVCDSVAHTIRKISGNTVSTFAGTAYSPGDTLGIGTAAQFNAPNGIAFDSQDNLFVCDAGNHNIKKITPDGTVTRFISIQATPTSYGQADGIGSDARLNNPNGIYIDKATNYMYITEYDNARIRRISPSGIVTTILGYGPNVTFDTGSNNGIDTLATFTEPVAITMDPSGSIFIAEQGGHRIRKASVGVDAQVGTFSQFSTSMDGIAIDKNGTLFIADYDHKIQKIDQHGYKTVFAGATSGWADGVGTAIRLNTPRGIVIDNYDNLFVMDTNNGNIRKITKGGVGTTIAGPTGASAGQRGHVDGTGTSVRFNYPNHPIVDSENNIYIADSDNYRIRKMTPQGLITTVAGSGPVGAFDGIGTNAGFSHMWGLYLDKFNNILVSDDSTIRKVNVDNFAVITFAGTGSRGGGHGFLRNAQFNQPCGLTGDNDGNIYITEYGNYSVRRISPTGQVTWFAGGGSGSDLDGIGTNAKFSEPIDVSFDSNTSCLYVSDRGNQRIRVIKVIPRTPISFANNPISATINLPNGQINFSGLLNFR